tara:strand:- start:393 stop:530 length:138 start_codon:yes stop_codon:yes gene_type:complete
MKASLSGKELVLRISRHLGCAIKELDKIKFSDLINLPGLTCIYHI